MDGIGPDEIKIRELIARVRNGTIKEVIIATSSTVPGEVTASYLIDVLPAEPIRLTRSPLRHSYGYGHKICR